MRIVTWNCNGGIADKTKLEYFKSFNADVAVLPEVRESHLKGLGVTDSIFVTNNKKIKSPKGLAVVSFNGFKLTALPSDPDLEIFIPAAVSGHGIEFRLLGIWNFYSRCKQGRYMGQENLAQIAFDHYKD